MIDTVFMIHGMWAGPWCWENFRRVFEPAGYRCVATTLPYHDMDPSGIPDPRLAATSLLDYAKALEREIRRFDEMPIVMDHSMGGLLAQILAARGLAKAVVLLTPASPAGIWAIAPSVIRSFWSIQTNWGWWRKPTRQTFAEAAYALLNLLPEAQQKQAYNRFVFDSGRATFEIGYWFFDRRGAARVDASKVTCPVLVLGSTLDRMVPASVARKVARKYTAVSTYKEFGNHAHWAVGEPRWVEVSEYVLAWLKPPGG
jgi:pimeloyl-ACP methyl ester carboxylesterase